jgi:hypothetical protein
MQVAPLLRAMKHIILLLATTTLALGGTSAYFWQEMREQRAHNETIQARVVQLESQLQNVPRLIPEPPLPPVAPELATPPMAPPPRPASRTEASSEPTFGRMDPTVFIARERERMKDPEYRALRLEQQKMGLAQMYLDLGTSLGLSQEQLDQLLGILAAHQLDSAPSFFPGEDASEARRSEWLRKAEESQRKQEADIRNLLGDGKYQEWQDYQGSMGARMQVRSLRSMLEGTSEPLREEQYEALVGAFVDAQRNSDFDTPSEFFKTRPPGPLSQSEQLTLMEQDLERTAQHNQRMRDAAAPHLSTAQLERYDKMLKQQLEMQRLNVRMMREQGETGAFMPFIGDGTTIVSSQGGVITQSVGTAVAAPPQPPRRQ